jgi:CBS domain-containing protein
MYLMNTRGSRYLAAFDEGKFIGIITIHDLIREALASKEDVFNNASQLLDTDESSKIF